MNATDLLVPLPRWRLLATALALGLAVALASYASLHLTRIGNGVASVWVSNGLVVGVLLLGARRHWPGGFGGSRQTCAARRRSGRWRAPRCRARWRPAC